MKKYWLDYRVFRQNKKEVDMLKKAKPYAWLLPVLVIAVLIARPVKSMVIIDSISANCLGIQGGIQLEWRTDVEIENIGFNIYRSTEEDGEYEKINPEMIPGKNMSWVPRTYRFRDATATSVGSTYWYKVQDIDFMGGSSWWRWIPATLSSDTLEKFWLEGPVPYPCYIGIVGKESKNTFGFPTAVSYNLPIEALFTLGIYDSTGDTVRILCDCYELPGHYFLLWDGKDEYGNLIPQGNYEYKFWADSSGTSINITKELEVIDIGLKDFTASGQNSSVLLEWSTIENPDIVQFNLYRSLYRDNGYIKIDSVSYIPGSANYSYVDAPLESGTNYYYKIGPINEAGAIVFCGVFSATTTGIEETENLELAIRVYPNPFLYQTKIYGRTDEAEIYDISGRLIRRIDNGIWDGKDISGKEIEAGIYFIKAKGCQPVKVVKLK